MATNKDKVADEVRDDSKRSNAGDTTPFADGRTDPDVATRGRTEDRVGVPVTTSFDERTGVTQPFVQPNGRQDNGAADLSEPEGARRTSTREGENTTVEETNVAIKEGTVGGTQKIGSEEDREPPKNPVAEAPETGSGGEQTDTQPTGKNTKPAN